MPVLNPYRQHVRRRRKAFHSLEEAYAEEPALKRIGHSQQEPELSTVACPLDSTAAETDAESVEESLVRARRRRESATRDREKGARKESARSRVREALAGKRKPRAS